MIQKKLIITITLLLSISLIASFEVNAKTVCVTAYDPGGADQGYVIYRNYRELYTCGSNTYQRYELRTPSSTSETRACSNSQGYMPTGLLKIRKGEDDACNPWAGSKGSYSMVRYVGSLTVADVCSDTYIPPGWIVESKNGDGACDIGTAGSQTSRWRIRKPTATNYTVCSGSNIPAGYAITGYGVYTKCKPVWNSAAYSGIGYTITSNITSGMSICSSSNFTIPSGFVITEKKYISKCGAGSNSGLALVVTAVENITTTSYICDGPYGEVIPDGLIITGKDNYTQCYGGPGAGTGLGFIVSPPNPTGSIVCEPSAVPSGYVIIEKDIYPQCGVNTLSGPGFKIRTPYSGLIVCWPSPIPEGWGTTESGQYPQCGAGTATGWGYKIAPISSGSVICDISLIPQDWVITAVATYPQCGGGGIGYAIQPPNSSGETDICYPSKMPAGYAKVQVKISYSQCGTFGGWTIAKPASSGETFICGDSPIPPLYVVTRIVTTSICGSIVNTGYYISQLTGDGPFILCNNTAVPNGFVIIAGADSYAHCGGIGGVTIIIPNATGTTDICSWSPFPSGYVVVELLSRTVCKTVTTTNLAYRIQYPNSSGFTTICNVTTVPIPSGYFVNSTGTASQCNPLTSSVISTQYNEPEPPPITPIVPTEFVNSEPDISAADVLPVTYDCSNSGNTPGFVSSAASNAASCP